MVTLKPLACRSLASDAEIIPFPNEEVTPPVTKIYLVIMILLFFARLSFCQVTGYKDSKIILASAISGEEIIVVFWVDGRGRTADGPFT